MLIAMRAITLSAFLILLAISVGEEFVPRQLWEQQLSGEVVGLAQDAIWAFLLAPVVIAIHRFVILEEITRAYAVPVGASVFGVFFGWLLALKVLGGLPFDLLGLLQALDWSPRTSTFAFAVALIAAVGVCLRLTILLPAIAVEAPGATPAHALADTRGQTLRILALFFLALAPWFAVDIGGVLLLGPRSQIIGTLPGLLFLVMGGALQTITLSLATVVASQAFLALAGQVRRTAQMQPQAPA
jgi:hypothetical protein